MKSRKLRAPGARRSKSFSHGTELRDSSLRMVLPSLRTANSLPILVKCRSTSTSCFVGLAIHTTAPKVKMSNKPKKIISDIGIPLSMKTQREHEPSRPELGEFSAPARNLQTASFSAFLECAH